MEAGKMTAAELELEDALVDVVNQSCWQDEHLDSMCTSAYADAMRLLARRGRLIIEREYGRGVRAHWKEAARD